MDNCDQDASFRLSHIKEEVKPDISQLNDSNNSSFSPKAESPGPFMQAMSMVHVLPTGNSSGGNADGQMSQEATRLPLPPLQQLLRPLPPSSSNIRRIIR